MTTALPRLALIGTGYWGKNLVRNFHSLGCLKMLCDRSTESLAVFQGQYPGLEICTALNEVLKRDDIDAVAIATPAEHHAIQVKEALLAGKHVFVEKPMALDEDDARELIDIAKERGLTLMVGHLLQYHPIFKALLKYAREGNLGRINYVYSNRLNLGKIRREENILWSFAPHDISMILSLAGEEPESVSAEGGCFLHNSIADVTTSHLNFPSGMQAHIFVSWLHPFKEQKLVVVGDKKMAVFDDTLPWEDKLLIYPHDMRWEDGVPVPVKAEPERLEITQDEPLKLECLHFLECVRDNVTPLTDGEEGVRVLSVLNRCQKALDRKEFRDIKIEYSAHESAVVDPAAAIGKGTKIWHFSHVMKNAVVGENCNIGQNVVVSPGVRVGNGCKIQNNVSLYTGVELEDFVFCGPSMVFTNVFNPRAEIRRMDETRSTLVKKGATLGANSTIVCGNTIGSYAFVGAGAVVTKSIPDHALVMGNPARQDGWMCSCGIKLKDDLTCSVCGKAYVETDTGLQAK
ncbi:Gfo/Idh/MocA family oxidoreductase [Pseudodesulfovibrio sediminis]|uniref:Oxidoreductase n=1 Tax=Pseudodesulfovibrio sediminis TaxID=2810563 RepID=A0ABN6EWE7_9BACT|nr:Gfo/Idh/MocA family oxidoreductase [Pseudodesulfovibrio sediminis]BCS89173.1 oxidoreductase [Pseudodesulfovibrio sediminis]